MTIPDAEKRLVRYATSLDSTSIAYWSIGKGRTLFYAIGGPWNQLELWNAPECQAWYERLTEDRRIIRYDVRGTGLSQRDVREFSLQADLEDLNAVAESVGVEKFDLFGGAGGAQAAANFLPARKRAPLLRSAPARHDRKSTRWDPVRPSFCCAGPRMPLCPHRCRRCRARRRTGPARSGA